jgi:N utilization substance protein A
VLDLDPEELARRADLEDETVQHVISVLKAEFED